MTGLPTFYRPALGITAGDPAGVGPELPVRAACDPRLVLALYHDQGLGPIKHMGFGESVNMTLGPPFVRTWVDRGTFHDTAGKGIARPDGMSIAIRGDIRLT